MFLPKNYRLTVTAGKFDLTTFASFKNMKFPQNNYQADNSETSTLYCLYCSARNFLPRTSSKILLNYFIFFRWKPWKAKMQNLWRETDKNQLIAIQLFICYKPACLQKSFHGRVLSIRVFLADGHHVWADNKDLGQTPATSTAATRTKQNLCTFLCHPL